MGLLDNLQLGFSFDPLSFLSDMINTDKTNKANAQATRETNAANLQIAQEANEWNYKMFKENQAYQTQMANTAVQRKMADLRAAGMNPLLAAGGEGAATPSMTAPTAVTAQMQPTHADKMDKAQLLGLAMELRRKKAEDDNLRASTALYEESKAKTEQERQKAQWEAEQAHLNYLRSLKESTHDDKNIELDIAAKELANEAQMYDNTLKKVETFNTEQRGYVPKSQAGSLASDITDLAFENLRRSKNAITGFLDSARSYGSNLFSNLQNRKEDFRQAKIEKKIQAEINKRLKGRKLTPEQEAYIRANLYENLSKKYK